LSSALQALAEERSVEHPLLDAVTIARLINRAHGGPVISAWQVDELDDTWVNVFVGMYEELPKARARQRLIKQKHKEFEASHPNYGKYGTQRH